MDFVKKAASSMGDNKESSSSSSSSAESGSGSGSGSGSSGGGQYDQYISKGVDYAEQKFMGTDTSNKSDSVKARDDKITVS